MPRRLSKCLLVAPYNKDVFIASSCSFKLSNDLLFSIPFLFFSDSFIFLIKWVWALAILFLKRFLGLNGLIWQWLASVIPLSCLSFLFLICCHYPVLHCTMLCQHKLGHVPQFIIIILVGVTILRIHAGLFWTSIYQHGLACVSKGLLQI